MRVAFLGKGNGMKSLLPLILAAAAIGVAVPVAMVQAERQPAAIVQVDPQRLASGLRASHIVGSMVRNEANETVGRIDDLIVASHDGSPFAVLSVRGFFGLGTKSVMVPYTAFRLSEDRITLPGATREGLRALPDFDGNS